MGEEPPLRWQVASNLAYSEKPNAANDTLIMRYIKAQRRQHW